MTTARPSDPTADLRPDPAAGARGIWVRRAFLGLLALIVLLALLGFAGVRSRTVHGQSADGSMTVAVRYAQVARAGLDVPFEVTVTRPEGFAGDLAVHVSNGYLDLFDRNAVDPEPSSGASTEQSTVWRFDQPRGDTFLMTLDMQVQGGRHFGTSGFVVVRDRGDGTTARATFKTWLVP